MMVAFERVTPVLPVRNVAEALRRYGQLGFQPRPHLEPGISAEDDPSYGYPGAPVARGASLQT